MDFLLGKFSKDHDIEMIVVVVKNIFAFPSSCELSFSPSSS